MYLLLSKSGEQKKRTLVVASLLFAVYELYVHAKLVETLKNSSVDDDIVKNIRKDYVITSLAGFFFMLERFNV